MHEALVRRDGVIEQQQTNLTELVERIKELSTARDGDGPPRPPPKIVEDIRKIEISELVSESAKMLRCQIIQAFFGS